MDELARVTKAGHLIENAIKRAKSQAGLSDYQTRTWSGWHHHNVLSRIATWFWACEMRRGKKIRSRCNASSDSYAFVMESFAELKEHFSHCCQQYNDFAFNVLTKDGAGLGADKKVIEYHSFNWILKLLAALLF